MTVGVPQRVNTAAVFLLVEVLALADLDHARRAATLAPVVFPVHHTWVLGRRTHAAVVDLLHVLPTRYTQRTGDHRKAMLMRIQRRALEAHVEAHGAAHAALGLVLHPPGPLEPVVPIVVGIDEGHAELLGEADVLVLAQLVFLERMDVGVVEEDGVVDARGQHGLHDLARARRAAGMQQHLVMAAGQRKRFAFDGGVHLLAPRAVAVAGWRASSMKART
mmetsp:Transcript_12864/g.30211  ORF Transcript_12864/g.30211 Transcript_12864/m.30211 type:complete len:220 (-) Transcript_12864:931-1590(-)